MIRWRCTHSAASGSLRIVHLQWPFWPRMQPVLSRGNISLFLVEDIWKRHEMTYYLITWAYCTSQFTKRWSDVCGVKILSKPDIDLHKLWTKMIYFIQIMRLILHLFLRKFTHLKFRLGVWSRTLCMLMIQISLYFVTSYAYLHIMYIS